MNDQNRSVDLGFARLDIPSGAHICQIYNDDDERNNALLRFLTSGLLAKECSACFSDEDLDDDIQNYLAGNGIDFSDAKDSGALILSKASEAYFAGHLFDPDRMLNLLSGFQRTSVENGYSGARVIGEMTPQIKSTEGGNRLMEYEAGVNVLLHDCPLTAVCQYDARSFDGATIMDVMRVHPMMLVRGNIIHNPFYQPPEQILP